MEFFALIFNQKDMMLSQIIQLPLEGKQKTRPFKTEILNPFGYRGKQYIDHDGLLYCYTIKGDARQVRSTKFSKNSVLLKDKIKGFVKDKNIVGVTPSRFVSPSGTSSWLFNVTSSVSQVTDKETEDLLSGSKLQNVPIT